SCAMLGMHTPRPPFRAGSQRRMGRYDHGIAPTTGGHVLLERIYDEDLSQTSYLIACQASGEAIVVDPRRDIQVYLDLAAQHGLRITAVTETHLHADV